MFSAQIHISQMAHGNADICFLLEWFEHYNQSFMLTATDVWVVSISDITNPFAMNFNRNALDIISLPSIPFILNALSISMHISMKSINWKRKAKEKTYYRRLLTEKMKRFYRKRDRHSLRVALSFKRFQFSLAPAWWEVIE